MSELVREYFYTVDRDGVLYHDGTALSDERFLRQFFRRLRRDENECYEEYPYVSPCAGELNYVRAEATVVVFRRMTLQGDLEYAAGLTVRFDPAELRVSEKGRLADAPDRAIFAGGLRVAWGHQSK